MTGTATGTKHYDASTLAVRLRQGQLRRAVTLRTRRLGWGYEAQRCRSTLGFTFVQPNLRRAGPLEKLILVRPAGQTSAITAIGLK